MASQKNQLAGDFAFPLITRSAHSCKIKIIATHLSQLPSSPPPPNTTPRLIPGPLWQRD